ncbi:hypothetical protein IFM89_010740 [Coptis chinensis]|uniref:Uncharacterized protein n=1 Tax=Coptis chinensis TaxID=261450 RepID=A0A835IJG7_9MAGN|nr:hypothetical protein IFM89_010740 [Coptis chinensis]
MTKALKNFLKKAKEDQGLGGVIGLGGSGGTSLISTALKTLPIGVPKVIVSTVASVLVGYCCLMLGLLWLEWLLGEFRDLERLLTVGITMFGVTTSCVNVVKERLKKDGYETMVFHATGVGGRALEDLVKGGFVQSLTGAPGDKQGTLEFLKLIFRALCLCWDRQTQDLHIDWVLYRGRSLVPVSCEVVNDNIDGFYP